MPLMAPVNWSSQIPKPLILIAAQSGRFLAQIAHRAGYPVRVADQFADSDTLAIAEQHALLPDFQHLTDKQFLDTITRLANQQTAILIIGTGLECIYNCLPHLPAHIQVANNNHPALQTCLTPQDWFSLLSKHGIAYPASQFSPPNDTARYLQKMPQKWGGGHIRHQTKSADNHAYFQQYIAGRSGSVLFIADGNHARLICLNEQFCRHPAAEDYRLQAITNNLHLNTSQREQITQICQTLSSALALCGFQSLDFMIDALGKIWILELNPRPSASLQCLPDDWPLLDWHLNACQGQLPDIEDLPTAPPRIWFGVYADKGLRIPSRFNWPYFAADLPAAGTHIASDQIVCSLCLALPENSDLTQIQHLATHLQLQLQKPLEKPLNSAI